MEKIYRYTWKDRYILPFESKWSIEEKFCYLNAYTYSQYNKVKVRNGVYNEIDHYKKNRILSPILFKLSQEKFENVFIRICPVCMKYGYHATLHQNLLFSTCYVHKHIDLIETSHFYKLNKSNELLYPLFYPENNAKHIIQNTVLKNDINKALSTIGNKVKKVNVLDYNRPNELNIIIPYKSTKQQLKHLLYNNNTLADNVDLILMVNKQDLFKIWRLLIYSKLTDVCINDSIPYIDKNDILPNKYVENYIEIKDDGTISRYYELYGVMMVDIILKFILSIGKEKYDNCSLELSQKEKYDSPVAIIASIMAIYSITGSINPYFYKEMMDGWGITGQSCSYHICLRASLYNDFAIQHPIDDVRKYKEIFTSRIMQDAFIHLSQDILFSLQNGEIDLHSDLRYVELNPCVPQYLFVEKYESYYIYSCKKN